MDRAHGTVRLIPLADAESQDRRAGRPGTEVPSATCARPTSGLAAGPRRGGRGLVGAGPGRRVRRRPPTTTSERTRVAYERARMRLPASRAGACASEQRRADDAKLALRQAYEQVAHLEGMRGVDPSSICSA